MTPPFYIKQESAFLMDLLSRTWRYLCFCRPSVCRWTLCTSWYLQQWDVHMPSCCLCLRHPTPLPSPQDTSWSKIWWDTSLKDGCCNKLLPVISCPNCLLFVVSGENWCCHEHSRYPLSLSGHEHLGRCHVWLELTSRLGSSHQQDCCWSARVNRAIAQCYDVRTHSLSAWA